MADQSAIDMAVRRLALALDALDRAKLAAALDGESARSRRLESTNREVAARLDAAMASIQSVLDGQE